MMVFIAGSSSSTGRFRVSTGPDSTKGAVEKVVRKKVGEIKAAVDLQRPGKGILYAVACLQSLQKQE